MDRLRGLVENRVSADAQLGPLADNGGPTDTHALQAGSPAIDAGGLGECAADDQRGRLRPAGAACDAGAFELGAGEGGDTTPPAAPTVETVEVAGTTVTLSGQAEPGAHITVFEGAAEVGTTQAGPDGRWRLTLANVAPGDHTYSAVARDSAGNSSAPSAPGTASVAQTPPQTQPPPPPPPTTPTPAPVPNQPLPPPVVNQNVNLEPEGTVRIKLPGSNRFITLKEGEQVPVGTTIDTTKGRVTLTSIGKGGKQQSADFYDGIFKVTQTKGANPVTVLTLTEKLTCPKARAGAAAGKKKRKLWGEGEGNFRTTGRLSSATVRGTTWLVEDTCTTTRTRVTKGAVTVKDFVTGKTIVVRAKKSYTARQRRR